ncbi:MAG TPA: RIP metalloprotease RseP, partial [Bacteroidia bacterium]|nr:RIP metalloprotease RseP [Bacteroidia bacterium]
IENAKYGIVASDLAKKIGFKNGDKVLEVNGEKVERFKDITAPRHYMKENAVYKVQRDGQVKTIVLPAGFVDSIADNKNNFITERQKFFVDSVEQNANGKSAPLMKGDQILAVNDTAVEFFDEFKARLANIKNADIPVVVLRNNDTVNLTVNVDENGAIGFRPKSDLEFKNEYFSFTGSISEGWNQAKENLSLNLSVFGKIFKGEVNASKAVSGPIGIAGLFSSEWDWQQFWQLTGLLSIILAFMNILPIPALDGGHVLFLLVEMVIGRPLPEKFMHVMQVIGMILLLGLMVFAFGNDIYKVFTR